MRTTLLGSVLTGLLLLPSVSLAASFSDVPPTHPAYDAVEDLKARGIIGGYPDGTFKPDKKVNRAEAAKIIVAPLVTQTDLDGAKTSAYSDFGADAWFAPYVELARSRLGFIDGPPKATAFYGERPVIKAEFLKMALLANKVDPGSFGEIRLPLSDDVQNPDEWYYPFLRYGIASSMTMVSANGTFDPGRELTRGDVAILLHRFLMYKEGRRTQALLSEAEGEIIVTLKALESNNLSAAEHASARALLAARGAHARMPDTPIVQGALKTTEAFRSLVRAYGQGVEGNLQEVVRLCGEAWNLAEQAKGISKDLALVAEQVQGIAGKMADDARGLIEAGATPQ